MLHEQRMLEMVRGAVGTPYSGPTEVAPLHEQLHSALSTPEGLAELQAHMADFEFENQDLYELP